MESGGGKAACTRIGVVKFFNQNDSKLAFVVFFPEFWWEAGQSVLQLGANFHADVWQLLYERHKALSSRILFMKLGNKFEQDCGNHWNPNSLDECESCSLIYRLFG